MTLDDDDRLAVLELFHGPTAAFKDFGARFLAACFSRLRRGAERPLTILVATSGDTGGAVAAAFHGRPGIEVAVLFPKGLVSPTQQRQLTCWGGNVRALAVRGTFDDCQRLVKEAFLDAALRKRSQLSSANSINLGRLLPQGVYYAATSLAAVARARRAGLLRHPERQPRQRGGVPVGARRWACRSARSCWRTTPTARCRTTSRAAAGEPRAEHRDTRLRDGRRQPEQHGAPARAVPAPQLTCATR